MMRLLKQSAIALSVLLLLPSAAFAQAAIAGTVKDTSGAVLPGVTVEASSPALIEKIRTVVTDGSGQYNIVNLRPGTYTVGFTLAGFNTVKREGIELTGNFVASINVDLKVGALEETITVSGETPIVDVQSARTQTTISKDTLAAIPSGRNHLQLVALIPGMQGVGSQDVGGASATSANSGTGSIHGGSNNDGRLLSDGLNVGYNGGTLNMWLPNTAASQETVVSTSGGLGEADTGGVVINVIPREGGNTIRGTVFFAGANSSMASSNYTPALQARGLSAPNTIDRNIDFNPTFGGRIIRDRLWFYVTHRELIADNLVAGMYVNKNAGNPNAWTYEPDLSQQAVADNSIYTASVRLTYQATKRNKFNSYWDEQIRCNNCSGGGTATQTIEATTRNNPVPNRVGQLTWQSPVTSRVLLEAGLGMYHQRFGGQPRKDGTRNQATVSTQEQAGSIPGLIFRQPASYSHSWTGLENWRASISYVTGAHNMKFGYVAAHDAPTANSWNETGITNYRMSSGVLNRFTMTQPLSYSGSMKPLSLYAQDSWSVGRLTLQGGVRYDHMKQDFVGSDRTVYPTIQAGPFNPVAIEFKGEDQKGANYHDLSPRLAASYNMFGDGKTALKVTLGRYVIAQLGNDPLNPILRTATSATRNWTDSNKNFRIDCALANNAAQNLSATGGDICGASSDQLFGTGAFNATFDRDFFEGWGKRPYNWEFSTSIQHELMPRVALNVGFFRRWYGNWAVTDNLAVGPADYDPFTITVTDARLPGGASTVTGIDLKPAKVGQVTNYITAASNYGKQIQHWNGVDVAVNVRLASLTLQGGTSTGREVRDYCELIEKLPETRFGLNSVGGSNVGFNGVLFPNVWNPASYCHQQSPFQTQLKGLASYTVPRVDVLVSGTFQSIPGVPLAAIYNAPNAVVTPSLGRALSGGAANTPINLVKPGTLYGDVTNQVDFRVAKVLRYGRTRAQIGFDIYNLTNSNAIQTYNHNLVSGGAWQTPTSILTGRFAKVSAQFDF